MTLKITIIGVDPLGLSLGLALKQSEQPLTIVAHDREPTNSEKAVHIGAADNRNWNLLNAVEGADLVVVNETLSQMRETLPLIASELRPDAVVTDMLALKEPVMALAREHLPPTVHFVGGAPLVSTTAPNAALFQKRRYALMPAPTAAEAAVRLVTNMVMLVGAEPLYMEAAEHDALRAAVDQLPLLLGAALLHTTTARNGWREMAAMADTVFEQATSSNVGDGVEQAALLDGNRTAVRYWLDAYRHELDKLAERLEGDSEEALREYLADVAAARTTWNESRLAANSAVVSDALDTAKQNNKLAARWFGWGRKK